MRRGPMGEHQIPDIPKDAPQCMMCRDSGLYFYDGTYRVCRAPVHDFSLTEKQKEADEANATLRRLEEKTAPRKR
jgi:hypothetical protein